MIRSPIVYSGSKYKLLSQLLPLFPSKINNFIDVFCGSCTVSLNVKAKNHFLNDSITPLIELYKNLKETTIEELIIRIEDVFTKYNIENNESKENYNTLRDDYNKTRDPLLLLVLTFISFNSAMRFNNKFEFNMPFGRKIYKNHYLKAKKIQLNDFIENSKTFNFYNCDFSDFLSKLIITTEDFVYLDPPYLITTAPYLNGKSGFGSWNVDRELKLLSIIDDLNNKGIKFGLSNVLTHRGKTNDILIEWSKNYNVKHINAIYSWGGNTDYTQNFTTDEVYIYNYEVNESLELW